MSLHIKDGGSWRSVDQPFVNVGGTWKTVREVHTKHGGTWRNIHTTPYTEYTLNPSGAPFTLVNLNYGDTGSFTVPTGQGIAYIWVLASGQGGGGGGGAYATEEHFTCSGSAFSGTKTGPETANGGAGGVGGSVTCIHPVNDGDYVSWSTFGENAEQNGQGGSNVAVNTPLVYTQMSSTGTYTGGTGENGFTTLCNIRDSNGFSKAQLWVGGGRGGTGGTLNYTQKCLNPGGYFGGATISASNGSTGATGQASNQVVASNAVSLTEGVSSLSAGAAGLGNDSGTGRVYIQLYVPDKY
jgi:hypothetical protein